MDEVSTNGDSFLKQTRSAFLWTRLLNIPFWVIFNMLPIILYKDLHATPFQVAMAIALKPLASLLSPYWSLSVNQRRDKLVLNLIWGNLLKFAPFLFFLWIHNVWLIVLCYGFYMILARGVIPAWMEIIKLNIKGAARERIFSYGSAIDYLCSGLLPLAFGWVLDDHPESWRWIFVSSAALGILSTFPLLRIPLPDTQEAPPSKSPPEPWLKKVIEPWTQSWNLLKKRPDFKCFQIGFMFGGAGLMMMQSALPMFFVDKLELSYAEMLFALSICKGIGFAATSPFWVKFFNRANIFYFSSWVTILAALFPFILMGASSNLMWLYVAYASYGMMQAGSELSWHMSGPVFAKEENSSIYSGTNVLTVGIRGFVPFLGAILCVLLSANYVLIIGAFLCLVATERMRSFSGLFFQKKAAISTP